MSMMTQNTMKTHSTQRKNHVIVRNTLSSGYEDICAPSLAWAIPVDRLR
jgi:hypothetical protein